MMRYSKPEAHRASFSAAFQETDLRSYFRQQERRFQIGLLLAFIVPLMSLSAYFHFQFQATLKETGQLNLMAVAESQRNTVDLFLQERVVNIFSLFHSTYFSLDPGEHQMERLLRQLRRASDAFIDVGFLNDGGIQTGYAGPFEYLQDKSYKDQPWFIQLLKEGQNYHISDIYRGLRNKLHFTIAAKQIIDGRIHILKATLDPEKFYLFLAAINRREGVVGAIINHEGRFQLADPRTHEPLGLSDYIPPADITSGARIIERNSDGALVAHAWLSEVQWALLVNQPLRVAYAQLYRARRIMLISSSIILAAVMIAIWFTTRNLIGKALENAEKHADLHKQLLHAAKLASLGELATGVAHEINNPLAIILATSGVIKDMMNPEFTLEWPPAKVQQELDTIDKAVLRARGITKQLLDFGRKSQPLLAASDINAIVEEVLSGLKGRALALENVTVVRNLQPDLPQVMVDPDQIRQVFYNLINNAGDAICGVGTISISTEARDDKVCIAFTDTGSGMTAEQIKKIFDPFFTTKEVGKGTGLGLSVSLSIVESMGGTIEVQSLPGAGSAFTVILPIIAGQGETHEHSPIQKQRQRSPTHIAD